jgi:hypothetical protein
MANSVNVQVLQDGPRNCTVKVEGVLDTSDLASQVLIDPAVLGGMDNTDTQKAATVAIQRLVFEVEDGLELRLAWDATTPVRIAQLTGRGTSKFEHFGGLVNNGGAGVTGKVLLSTEGWTTGKILSFTVILELRKQGRMQ